MADSVSNKDLYTAINEFRMEARSEYVTKDEFAPVKKAVYGTVGLILTAFVVVLIAVVYPNINKPTPIAVTPKVAASPSPTSNPPSATASVTSNTVTPSSSSGGLQDTLKLVGL